MYVDNIVQIPSYRVTDLPLYFMTIPGIPSRGEGGIMDTGAGGRGPAQSQPSCSPHRRQWRSGP